MNDFQNMADRFEIEALRGEFTDAGMMSDYDRFASLFTQDGVWQIPLAGIAFAGREEIRAGIERLKGGWDYFVQTAHPGTIRVDGDTAAGRSYIAEFGRLREGGSHMNHAIYHDRYERTADGWKFAERRYEVMYVDMSPLTGSVPEAH
ncbi:nuclear transport factor 2 family protein [Streptomyces beijiangensis]|uniref:Nuclear transport factor 2 family protein n=1 Tax=Streptomyces beijiangensis TaxID=163361 RepID=A0A939FEQ6_9ACTN|nr:nuclear transport factor 2 family protein [Streptomyces beijiangensis]MBO0516623.1 nuclear transport factor 2 family protein [Streptomyces beijiangensis]